ncbi:MAG TPA: hypothetical protein VHH34_23820 [Pseudonocardiaceae bacterium]|nr:hypothetical protein [Pseudonocardiaceae bacterium]
MSTLRDGPMVSPQRETVPPLADLAAPDALELLGAAPDPKAAAGLSLERIERARVSHG